MIIISVFLNKDLWRELLNSDATVYGGSGQGNLGGKQAVAKPFHGRPYSISLTIPPLGIVFLKNIDYSYILILTAVGLD